MSNSPPPPFFLATPFQRVVAALCIVTAIALATVVWRVPPKANRFSDWTYPDGAWISSSGFSSPAEGAVASQFTTNSFTNVVAHFVKLLGTPLLTGATFSYKSGSIMPWSSRPAHTGVYPISSPGEIESRTFVTVQKGQVAVVHVAHARGDPDTLIYISRIITEPNRKNPIMLATAKTLLPPGARTRSQTTGIDIGFLEFDTATNLAAVERYYTNASFKIIPQPTTGPGQLVQFSTARGAVTNAATNTLNLIYYRPGVFAFVHTYTSTNGTARGLIGVANY
jgi:hypothetical protein